MLEVNGFWSWANNIPVTDGDEVVSVVVYGKYLVAMTKQGDCYWMELPAIEEKQHAG